jgi:hypothetical protein
MADEQYDGMLEEEYDEEEEEYEEGDEYSDEEGEELEDGEIEDGGVWCSCLNNVFRFSLMYTVEFSNVKVCRWFVGLERCQRDPVHYALQSLC